jgi:nucleolar GTP-binding protein
VAHGPVDEHMKVEWRTLPTVLTEEEMLDKAFSRAKKAADRVEDRDRVFRTRKQLTRMVQTAADVLSTSLTETVKVWPSLDQSPEFDVAMIEACVGTDAYRHHLSILDWGAVQINKIATQNARKITRTAQIPLMHDARKEAYGRMSSIMGRVGASLTWLGESRETLKRLPHLDPLQPIIVVCGAPNVGKSAFIGALSTGTMEVNHYPFTTKQLHVGHFLHRRLAHQMLDTPGLLDRPMEDRNAIEMQAIAALEHVGSIALFLIDESASCGTPLEEQLHLLEEVRHLLPGTRLLEVTSKADLLEPRPEGWSTTKEAEAAWRDAGRQGLPELPLLLDDEGRPTVSAVEDVGLEALRLHLVRLCAEGRSNDALSLPDGWHRSDLEA